LHGTATTTNDTKRHNSSRPSDKGDLPCLRII